MIVTGTLHKGYVPFCTHLKRTGNSHGMHQVFIAMKYRTYRMTKGMENGRTSHAVL